jgi:homoserine O-acetyltransferase
MAPSALSELELQEQLRRNEADHPSSPVMRFGPDRPLALDSGASLAPWQIAYQTYGTLNPERSNAVLICHALTGDQHVANDHPVTGKPGWWTLMVGPGKPIDTDRFFVICANVLGGCMGTTGPASANPATGRAFGLDLPVLTIRDMVRSQAMLVEALGSRPCSRWSGARWAACRCCNGRRPSRKGSSRRSR